MEIKRLAYSFYSPLLSPSVSGQHFHLSSYSVCDKNQHFCYFVFIHVLDSSRIRYTSAHKSGSDLSLLDTALQDAGIVEKTWVNIQGLRVLIHLRVGELIWQRKSPSYLGLYFPILCLLFRPYWVENLLAPFLLPSKLEESQLQNFSWGILPFLLCIYEHVPMGLWRYVRARSISL